MAASVVTQQHETNKFKCLEKGPELSDLKSAATGMARDEGNYADKGDTHEIN